MAQCGSKGLGADTKKFKPTVAAYPLMRNLTSFVRYATIITGQADLGPGRMFRVGKCLVLDVVTSNAAKRATK